MNKFILGIVLTVLAFVAYPKRLELQCFFLPESKACQPVAPMVMTKAAPVPAEEKQPDIIPAPRQEIHKWVDDQGVVHFVDRPVGNSERIDQDLKEISVIESAADIKKINDKASGTLSHTAQRSSGAYRNKSAQVDSIKRKKEKCSRLSANRNKYPLNSSSYKYWGTRYREECLFN